ncbi:hypothetical protein [Cyanobium sp. ATX 6F1]|uniref:hypothetical protein n=1 Tax=unclassified Cyanobium TaxID=2627006 RepID=UPI0020CF6922|nr:hypothetical protein [Cyanobium sp. ATX 6F1]MCP9917737.1 hypothetical protein [Cyanobium sp. ATX 6F1]
MAGNQTVVGTTGSRACPQLSFTDLKERQLVWLLVRQLGHVQFERADAALSQRLWQEVAALGIDPERICALLYGGHDLGDQGALEELDRSFSQRCRPKLSSRRGPRGWLPGRPGRSLKGAAFAAGPRNAPPAAPQAHRAAG